MNKKYIVRLTAEQRATLEQRTRTGVTTASVQRHVRILLQADMADDGPAWDDATIAAALAVSVPTVERVRQRFVQSGLEGAIVRKPTTLVADFLTFTGDVICHCLRRSRCDSPAMAPAFAGLSRGRRPWP